MLLIVAGHTGKRLQKEEKLYIIWTIKRKWRENYGVVKMAVFDILIVNRTRSVKMIVTLFQQMILRS